MKLTIFILLFIINSFLSSCSDNTKLNSEQFEIKKVFRKDKKKFESIVNLLSENPNLNTIVRRTDDKIPELKKVPKSRDYVVSYLIRIIDKDIDIIVPREYSENENLFWQKDFSEIKGRYSNESLTNFLNDNISENNFKQIIFFLIDYNLFRIKVRPNEEIIYVENEYYEGIYYDPETTEVKPDLSPNAKIEKLEDHWYYYDDNRDLKR